MKRMNGRREGTPGTEEAAEKSGASAVGRRAMLARGGVVAAGLVGAGVAAAAVATPASAASGDPLLQDAVNNAGASATPTELDAANSTAPAFILANTGIDTSITPNGAGPALRLTPSSAEQPTASTVGGDLTTTSDGSLWFTHDFPVSGTPTIVAAPVHTEATSNVFVSLVSPVRIVDTRTAAGRANIVNASGNLDSKGRLKGGATIAVNLDSLVSFADAVFANLTIAGQAGSGYLTLWSGAIGRPVSSSINFPASGALSNYVSSAIAEYSDTVLNVIAVYAEQTTHVVLDIVAFALPGYEYANFTAEVQTSSTRASRLLKAQERMRSAKRA